jgi:hypothetical protein
MARMIPPVPMELITSTAELRLLAALREGLSQEWTVIHSLPWLDAKRSGRLREGECDFVLLHSEHGMLAIEAKSGDVTYVGSRKQWQHGDGTPMKDPFLQAQESMHFLNKLLQRRVAAWSRSKPTFGFAVAFPETDKMTGAFPPHVTPDVLITRGDLSRLEDRVVQVLGHFGRKAGKGNGSAAVLSASDMRSVTDALLPTFSVSRSVSARREDREAALFRLTQEQMKALDYAGHNKRLLVEGCAGSGKTVLAVEDAGRLADEGARVLFVCFNIPLADKVRERLAERAPGVDAFHFHGLCEEVVGASGGTFPKEQHTQEFFDVDCPQLLMDHAPGYAKRYDAIVADEAQDFCPVWWVALEELLADRKTGIIHAYTDERQNIFNRDNALPFTEPSIKLTTNCRNTTEIAALVREYGRIPLTCGAPRQGSGQAHGPEPQIVDVSSAEEEKRAIEDAIRRAIDRHSIAPGKAVVIGTHRFEHSAVAECGTLAGHALVDDVEHANGSIRYATVWRFKGLECDCAVLTGFDVAGAEAACPEPGRGGNEKERRLLYVAASRAKHCLWIIRR